MKKNLLLCAGVGALVAIAAGFAGVPSLIGIGAVVMLISLLLLPWVKEGESTPPPGNVRRHFFRDNPMPAWVEPERWEGLVSGAACPICRQGKPYAVVVELEHSYLTADKSVRVRGYCSLVWKKHVVELHQLSEADAAALMRELRIASAAVAKINEPVKLNHEIHGNTIPHLHVHIIPRYRGDELEESGKTLGSLSIDPYGAGEFEAFTRRLAAAVSEQVSDRWRGEDRNGV